MISENTPRLSAHKLITPLLITTSAQPSSTGTSSSRPSRNSTLSRPMAPAVARDFASISSVISMPTTWPFGPTWPAAMKQSKPPPASTTRSPASSVRVENGLATPAKDSTAASGSASTAPWS